MATGNVDGFLLVIDLLAGCHETGHSQHNLEPYVVSPGEGIGVALEALQDRLTLRRNAPNGAVSFRELRVTLVFLQGVIGQEKREGIW